MVYIYLILSQLTLKQIKSLNFPYSYKLDIIIKNSNSKKKVKNNKYENMDRLWRSRTTMEQKVIPKQQLLLPNSIGCRIIQLEMEIDDGNLNKQIIIELLQEYTKAVEFYQEKGDERYKLYQKKIQNFLQKNAVDAILKGKSEDNSNIILKKQKAQEQIRKATTNINSHTVKKLLETSDEGVQKQKLKIEKQLNFQLQNLQKRLERKRINSQKGTKMTSASFSASSTTDDGFLKSFQQVKNPKNKVYM